MHVIVHVHWLQKRMHNRFVLSGFVGDCKLKQNDLVWLQFNVRNRMTCNIKTRDDKRKMTS